MTIKSLAIAMNMAPDVASRISTWYSGPRVCFSRRNQPSPISVAMAAMARSRPTTKIPKPSLATAPTTARVEGPGTTDDPNCAATSPSFFTPAA